MLKEVFKVIFLVKIAIASTKESELPLCPTNVLYFPQNLPMHCRMPTSADFPGMAGAAPQFAQGPPSDKRSPQPVSIPMPPSLPGPMPIPGSIPVSGPMPFPGPMPNPVSMPLPGAMAFPGPNGPSGPIPFPGPMSLSPGPSQKLPVIVMPFYSPDTSFKKGQRPNYPQHVYRPRKRRIRHKRIKHLYSTDTSSNTDMDRSSGSSSSSSEYQGWWKGKRSHRRFDAPITMKKRKHKQRRQLLTPVLQYVTKDGYVIFEKKITKNEAKDWMDFKKEDKTEINTRVSPEARDMEWNEANHDRSADREVVTEEVEVVTKRNAHKLNKIKAQKDKEARKKLLGRLQ